MTQSATWPDSGGFHNLPTELTSFIGRRQEVAEVAHLLASSRLLTLTGAGGVGKTRLALQVARGLVGDFPDGVRLAELAPLVEPAAITQAVASAVGVRERSERSMVETLRAFVAHRQLLLVLDNCEHLVDACADLAAALISAGPDLRILATSREPLRIPGEVTWRVPSLAVPSASLSHSPTDLMDYAAIELFVDCARTAQPNFTLTQNNARAVREISARLDGMPLAIELAAAWLRALGVEEILQRLDDTFQLELGGKRTAPTRHQTMWAMLDWSHVLLSEPERVLLRRLSVFAGGWTLESAEYVCSGGLVECSGVFRYLTRLVDASLALVEEQAGRSRYRLLEPIRAYTTQQLIASGEAAAIRSRHAQFFVELAERLSTVEPLAPLIARLDERQREHENFRAALRWLADIGPAADGIRLVAALGPFWMMRGFLTEGREWLTRFIHADRDPEGSAALANALYQAGMLAQYQGDPVTARELHMQSLALWRELADHPVGNIAAVLDSLGLDAWDHGDYAEAQALCEEALQLARTAVWHELEANALYHLGLVAYDQMDWATANDRHAESLRVARGAHAVLSEARALRGLALVAHQQGAYGRALQLHEEGLAKRRQVGESWGVALALIGLGQLLLDTGDIPRARALFDESLTLSDDLGDREGLARSLEAFAGLAAVARQVDEASQLVRAAAELREANQIPLSPAERAQLGRRMESVVQAGAERAPGVSKVAGPAIPLDAAVALAHSIGQAGEHAPSGAAGARLASQQEHDRLPSGASSPASHDELTPRELEVLRLVAAGHSNRQIANELILSVRTVERHINNLYAKIGARGKADATAYAFRHGLT
jgi:predicted ATPase/DNA-binding CsgD family transcriptional regulator